MSGYLETANPDSPPAYSDINNGPVAGSSGSADFDTPCREIEWDHGEIVRKLQAPLNVPENELIQEEVLEYIHDQLKSLWSVCYHLLEDMSDKEVVILEALEGLQLMPLLKPVLTMVVQNCSLKRKGLIKQAKVYSAKFIEAWTIQQEIQEIQTNLAPEEETLKELQAAGYTLKRNKPSFSFIQKGKAKDHQDKTEENARETEELRLKLLPQQKDRDAKKAKLSELEKSVKTLRKEVFTTNHCVPDLLSCFEAPLRQVSKLAVAHRPDNEKVPVQEMVDKLVEFRKCIAQNHEIMYELFRTEALVICAKAFHEFFSSKNATSSDTKKNLPLRDEKEGDDNADEVTAKPALKDNRIALKYPTNKCTAFQITYEEKIPDFKVSQYAENKYYIPNDYASCDSVNCYTITFSKPEIAPILLPRTGKVCLMARDCYVTIGGRAGRNEPAIIDSESFIEYDDCVQNVEKGDYTTSFRFELVSC